MMKNEEYRLGKDLELRVIKALQINQFNIVSYIGDKTMDGLEGCDFEFYGIRIDVTLNDVSKSDIVFRKDIEFVGNSNRQEYRISIRTGNEVRNFSEPVVVINPVPLNRNRRVYKGNLDTVVNNFVEDFNGLYNFICDEVYWPYIDSMENNTADTI